MSLLIPALALTTAGSAGAQAPQQRVARPVNPSACLDPQARQVAAGELAKAILTAVQALPNTRSSSQDIEATILYVIGQRSLCPGVARQALASFTTGTPQFLEAVGYVRTSLIDTPAGTAGIVVNTGGGGSFTQFTSPIVGLGGGSATYSR